MIIYSGKQKKNLSKKQEFVDSHLGTIVYLHCFLNLSIA